MQRSSVKKNRASQVGNKVVQKSNGYVMQHQFNIQQLYVLPTLYLCVYLITKSDLCHFQHKQIAFYSRDEKCLQRGTDSCFLLHGGERPSYTLDTLLTLAHSHHTSAVC